MAIENPEPHPQPQTNPLTDAVTKAAWSQGWFSQRPSTAADVAEAALRAQHSFGTSSTGTPMASIHGIAFERAVESNIGGGSLATGGGGMIEGQQRIDSVRAHDARVAVGIFALEIGLKVGVPLACSLVETYVQQRGKARPEVGEAPEAEL